MTNFEFWKDELEKLTRGDRGGVAIVRGKPRTCDGLPCEECDRRKDCFDSSLVGWLLSEHGEKPKLTKKERMFCELVETGWIARDKSGELNLFKNKKPLKDVYGLGWFANGHLCGLRIDAYLFIGATFSFVEFEDKEPWSVEDLLKLEVE